MVQVEADMLEELDRHARESGKSRAAVARSAIEAALAQRRREEEIQQVVNAYRGSAPENLALPKKKIRSVWPE